MGRRVMSTMSSCSSRFILRFGALVGALAVVACSAPVESPYRLSVRYSDGLIVDSGKVLLEWTADPRLGAVDSEVVALGDIPAPVHARGGLPSYARLRSVGDDPPDICPTPWLYCVPSMPIIAFDVWRRRSDVGHPGGEEGALLSAVHAGGGRGAESAELRSAANWLTSLDVDSITDLDVEKVCEALAAVGWAELTCELDHAVLIDVMIRCSDRQAERILRSLVALAHVTTRGAQGQRRDTDAWARLDLLKGKVGKPLLEWAGQQILDRRRALAMCPATLNPSGGVRVLLSRLEGDPRRQAAVLRMYRLAGSAYSDADRDWLLQAYRLQVGVKQFSAGFVHGLRFELALALSSEAVVEDLKGELSEDVRVARLIGPWHEVPHQLLGGAALENLGGYRWARSDTPGVREFEAQVLSGWPDAVEKLAGK